MSRIIVHRGEKHGVSSNGMVYIKHTFSYADYFNRERINFGVLRSINNMTIAPGKGLEQHLHSDMEIVMIMLKGDVRHHDSLGNETELHKGYVQTITSGNRYEHKETNLNNDISIKMLHFWIFPFKKGLNPNYTYKKFNTAERKNQLQLLASPREKDNATLIQQNAWVYITEMDAGNSINYELNLKGNGVYIYTIKGEIETESQCLKQEDGIGIWDTNKLEIKALDKTQFIILEVPMNAYSS